MECTGGQECVAPGQSPGCGTPPLPCTSDLDCGTGAVCEMTACGAACIPACTANSCPTGEVCSNQHCRPQPCDGGHACPQYFVCALAQSSSQCLRQTCAADKDCSGGFCVDGACYGGLGVCTYPPV
jgi:hypothetical protein